MCTSPRPRPGIFPPTLKGSGVALNVFPWSAETKMLPLFGSQKFVYIPTAWTSVSDCDVPEET